MRLVRQADERQIIDLELSISPSTDDSVTTTIRDSVITTTRESVITTIRELRLRRVELNLLVVALQYLLASAVPACQVPPPTPVSKAVVLSADASNRVGASIKLPVGKFMALVGLNATTRADSAALEAGIGPLHGVLGSLGTIGTLSYSPAGRRLTATILATPFERGDWRMGASLNSRGFFGVVVVAPFWSR